MSSCILHNLSIDFSLFLELAKINKRALLRCVFVGTKCSLDTGQTHQ